MTRVRALSASVADGGTPSGPSRPQHQEVQPTLNVNVLPGECPPSSEGGHRLGCCLSGLPVVERLIATSDKSYCVVPDHPMLIQNTNGIALNLGE